VHDAVPDSDAWRPVVERAGFVLEPYAATAAASAGAEAGAAASLLQQLGSYLRPPPALARQRPPATSSKAPVV
jgi:hypothetical protein